MKYIQELLHCAIVPLFRKRKQCDRTTAQHLSAGFTLLELIVVMSIIAILTSLLTVNFIAVRLRGRDAQRKTNIRQMQAALEIYRSDQGMYPTSLPTCGNAFTNGGTTTYMQKIPCDPSSGASYWYSYDGTSSPASYCIRGCLENVNDSEKDSTLNPTMSNCTTPALPLCAAGTWSFTVQNP